MKKMLYAHYFPLIPFLIVILTPLLVLTDTETIHWEWRDLICQISEKGDEKTLSQKPAECTIALRENEKDTKRRLAPKGAGCFDENVNGTTRTYCDLLCPKADTVYIISNNPHPHRFCHVFYSHKLERRGDDWFLWRQHKCRFASNTITIRCEFLFSRRETPKDEVLFSSLVRRRKN